MLPAGRVALGETGERVRGRVNSSVWQRDYGWKPVVAGSFPGFGVLWLALTLASSSWSGTMFSHQPWTVLLEDYDMTRGRIWVLVLLVILFAPLLSARAQRLY